MVFHRAGSIDVANTGRVSYEDIERSLSEFSSLRAEVDATLQGEHLDDAGFDDLCSEAALNGVQGFYSNLGDIPEISFAMLDRVLPNNTPDGALKPAMWTSYRQLQRAERTGYVLAETLFRASPKHVGDTHRLQLIRSLALGEALRFVGILPYQMSEMSTSVNAAIKFAGRQAYAVEDYEQTPVDRETYAEVFENARGLSNHDPNESIHRKALREFRSLSAEEIEQLRQDELTRTAAVFG